MSVAMAVYNGARYLKEQLDSISAQDRMPDELIVSDNHSTDETVRIVEDFAASAAFAVRLHVNEANVGVSQNFARAITLCRGDVICLADCDDVWYSTKLKRIEQVFSRQASVGMVFSDADVVDEHLVPMGYHLWRNERRLFRKTVTLSKGCRALGALFRWRPAWVGHTMAFDAYLRSLFLPIPDLPLMQVGGYDLWIALLGVCVTNINCIGEPLVAHRRHSAQSTAGQHKLAPRARLKRARQPFATTIPLDLSSLVRQRLESALDKDTYRDCVRALSEWSYHLTVRSNLAPWRIKRLPSIARELASGRYYRFSNGVLSAIRDIYSEADHHL